MEKLRCTQFQSIISYNISDLSTITVNWIATDLMVFIIIIDFETETGFAIFVDQKCGYNDNEVWL